eukprot:3279083-Pyramimonas_sp.AAC.1
MVMSLGGLSHRERTVAIAEYALYAIQFKPFACFTPCFLPASDLFAIVPALTPEAAIRACPRWSVN